MKVSSFLKVAIIAGALGIASQPAMADGMLRYATVGEPPSLDQHVLTSDLATTIAHHMFEGLYTFNAANAPVNLLASGDSLSEDGKTITISLRDDVTFHNGQAMTSADVVASMKRWGEFGSRGGLLFGNVDSIEATGDHEITLKLSVPFGPWKNLLAFINGGPAIYPATVMEGATKEPISPEQYIGTGPYKFSEWKPNRHVELVRFDDYVSPPGAADGYGGERKAEFDTLRFMPVPDVGTRVAGLQAGDYDYAESIPGDLYADLDADSNVETILNGGPIFGLVFLNSKEGPLKENFALRLHLIKLRRYKLPLVLKVCGGPTDRSYLKAMFGTQSPALTISVKVMQKLQSPWRRRLATLAIQLNLWCPLTIRFTTTRLLCIQNSLRKLDLILIFKCMTGQHLLRNAHNLINGTCFSLTTASCQTQF